MNCAACDHSASSSPGSQREVIRSGRGPTNYTGKFTWVNKDISSQSRNSKDQIHHVHAHVQAQFMPWSRRQRKEMMRSDNASKKILQDSDSPSSNDEYMLTPSSKTSPASCSSESDLSQCSTVDTDHVELRRLDRFATGMRSQTDGYDTAETTPEKLVEDDDCSELAKNEIQPSSDPCLAVITPTSIVGNGNYDPFNASTIYIDATRHELLLLWGERVMNAIWPSLRTQKSKQAANKAWAEDCREGVDDEIYLHGLLASAFIVKARLLQHKDTSSATRLRLESYAHQAKCLKQIRQSLIKAENSRRIVLAIWAAASVSLLDGDVATCRLHLVNLKTIVDQLGGLKELPMLMRHKILIWDVVTAGFMLQRPVFPTSDWRSPRLKNLLMPVVDAEVMQQVKTMVSIQKYMPIHSTITEKLRKNLIDHREALAVKNYADSLLTDMETAAVLDSWLYLRQKHLEASNLALFDQIKNTASEGDSSKAPGLALEACFCLAITYMHRFIARHALESAGCTPFYHLRSHIELFLDIAPDPLPSPIQMALLWMYFIGACGESELNRSLPSDKQQTWFTENLLNTAREVGLTTFSDLRETFRKFLYDSTTLDDFLMCLLVKQDDYKGSVTSDLTPPTSASQASSIKSQKSVSKSSESDLIPATSNLGPIFRWTEKLTLVCSAPRG